MQVVLSNLVKKDLSELLVGIKGNKKCESAVTILTALSQL
jgi:hypothetical protein